MNEFDDIQKTLKEIEPPSGAKERMLANIRSKAEKTEKEDETLFVKEEKSTIRWNSVILRVALPVAACIVIAVVLFARFIPKDPMTQSPEGDLFTSPYTDVSSVSELASLLQIPFSIPAGASEISCSMLEDKIGYVNFTMDDYYYEMIGSKDKDEINDLYGTLLEEEIIDSQYSATLATYDSDGLILYRILWSDGINHYCLTNLGDCAKEDIEAVYFGR